MTPTGSCICRCYGVYDIYDWSTYLHKLYQACTLHLRLDVLLVDQQAFGLCRGSSGTPTPLRSDKAFAGVVIAPDRGIALNKDSSTTTMCVNEHQHHKKCYRIYPSLGLLNFHYFRVPLSHPYKYSYLILPHSSFSHIVVVYLERCT